jgi:hypothetical protein
MDMFMLIFGVEQFSNSISYEPGTTLSPNIQDKPEPLFHTVSTVGRIQKTSILLSLRTTRVTTMKPVNTDIVETNIIGS